MTSAVPCDDEQGWKTATSAILRAMLRTRFLLKALAGLLLSAVTAAAVTPAGRWACGPVPVAVPSAVAGRVLIMPGVGNTTFHLAGFVAATEAQLPRFDVEVRAWGEPFMTIHNLRAHERNV